MAYTIEEQIEELQSAISKHEEILALLVSSLVNEENLTADTKDGINAAYKELYGEDFKY